MPSLFFSSVHFKYGFRTRLCHVWAIPGGILKGVARFHVLPVGRPAAAAWRLGTMVVLWGLCGRRRSGEKG